MSDNKIQVVYRANSRNKISFIKCWLIMFNNIKNSRELIYQLFKRDFFAVYKKSFLGVGWIFISPVIGIFSWVFMNYTGVLTPGDVGIPYPAYVLLSTSIWGLFMGFYKSALGTLGAGSGFIMQVKYPHEVLLVKQIAQQLANFILGFLMNIAVLLFFGVIPDWKIILFPIMVLPLFFLGAGIGLVVSVISVVVGEIQRFLDIFLGYLIFITPVIYAKDISNPLIQTLIKYNPLTYLIGGIRDVIIYGRMDNFKLYSISALASFIVFLIAWRTFFVSEERAIEKMV